MKKFLSGLALALLVACSNGGPTTPDLPETAAPAPAPVAAATPAPQPVNDPPPTTPQHDARVKGGFYSVTNTTGVPQFYCAAAFGVLPGGEQGAGTNLYEDQGIRQNKDVFSGQAPKTAACQYKQIQVDLTQSKDCKNFDWHNVLAAEVYDNPGYIAGSEKEKLEALAYGEWGAWGSWSQESCGTRKRSRDVFEQYKYKCSGEVVKVKVRVEEEVQTKECCVSTSFQLSSLTFPTYTPKKPAIPATLYYYDGEGEFQNDCTDEGGQYFGNKDGRVNVCYTSHNHGSSWLYDTHPNNRYAVRYGDNSVAEVPASGGNPISGSATVQGAGVWKLVLKATDPGNYEKDVDTKTLDCDDSAKTLSVSYNWVGHSSEKWQLLLYKDNVLVASSAVVNNPSN